MKIEGLESERQRKRLRIEIMLMIALGFMAAVIFWLQGKLLQLPSHLGTPNILFWALINLNVILILLLLFLVLRNMAKLVFERRSKIIGSKLRTKLTVAFAGFALLPTGLFFLLTYAFVSNSLERWFELKEKTSGKSSMNLVMNLRDFYCGKALVAADVISSLITEQIKGKGELDEKSLKHLIERLKYRAGADLIILKLDLKDREQVVEVGIKPSELERAWKRINLIESSELIKLDEEGTNLAAIARQTINIGTKDEPRELVIWAGFRLGPALSQSISEVTKAYQQTQQFLLLKTPIKTSYTIILILITSLILFGSTWFAFYIAKGLSEPINELSKATEKIARGEWEIEFKKVADDELGQLSRSFERMTRELRQNRAELEKTARELEQRKRYLETLLSTVSSGVVALDPQGRITTINESAKSILEIATDEPLGKVLTEILPPAHRDAILPILDPILSGKTEKAAKKFEIPAAPEVRSIWVSASAINFEGKPIGAVLVVEELTQILRAERLEEWRVVTEYLAHDIKNPLTAIRSASEAIAFGLKSAPDADADLIACSEAIIRQTEGLSKLVERLRHLAQAGELRKRTAELNPLIKEIVSSYAASHSHIEFETQLDENLPAFEFDPEQIERVFVNVIDNAIAAIESRGKISITTQLDGSVARIKVADDGKGIPKEFLDRLFEPHFSTKRRGTGLGLAIVHKIITEHGGKVFIEPNEPKGTVVIFELPLGQGGAS